MKSVLLSLLLCSLVAPALVAQNNWHLDRIDQRHLPLDCSYDPVTSPGGPTRVYIVSTGIDATHPELPSVAPGFTFGPTGDVNGAGTRLASLVGGTDHGVADSVILVPVTVLNSNGSGSISNINAGLGWIHTDIITYSYTRTVVLLGFRSNTYFPATAAALDLLYSVDGATIVTGAGNSNADACSEFPAMLPDLITVGASDSCDKSAPFTNWGTCVDIFAPGVDVEGAVPGTGTGIYSGTDTSAALVAGAACVFINSQGTAPSPATVNAYLTANATVDALSWSDPSHISSPNLLLYVDGTPPATPCTWSPASCTPCTSGSATVNAVYSLSGGGVGTPWSWKIEFPGVPSLNSGVQSNAGVTGTAADVASAFAKEINDYFDAVGLDAPDTSVLSNYYKFCAPPLPAHDFQAIVTDCFGSVFMEVRAPCEFKLFVSPVGTPSNPTCEVTSTTACQFNPGIWEIPMSSQDCNENGQDDSLDIGTGISLDANSDSIPDECQGGGVNAWSDQGSALAGVNGDPLLVGMGTLAAGSHNVIDLSHAAPSAPAYLFYGVASAPVSLWGGELLPGPVLAWLGPFQTSPTGELVLTHDVPATGYPSGAEIWLQWALLDTAAIHNRALSNTIMGKVP